MQSSDSSSHGTPEYVAETRFDLKFSAQMLCLELIGILFLWGAATNMTTLGPVFGTALMCFSGIYSIPPVIQLFYQPGTSSGSRVRRTTNGSTVRYRHAVLWLCIAVVVFAGSGVLLLGLGPGSLFAVIPFAVVAAACFAFPVVILTGKVRQGFVELTPNGVTQRGYGFVKIIPWELINDVRLEPHWPPSILVVTDYYPPYSHTKTTRLPMDANPSPLPGAFIDCRFFDIHPVVFVQWIRFYRDYPTLRKELGTNAATERLASLLP